MEGSSETDKSMHWLHQSIQRCRDLVVELKRSQSDSRHDNGFSVVLPCSRGIETLWLSKLHAARQQGRREQIPT